MKRKGGGLLWILLLIALAGAGYYFWQQSRVTRQGPDGAAEPPPNSQAGSETPSASAPPVPPAPPMIRYPIEEDDRSAAPESLPKLEESDPMVEEGLSALVDGDALKNILRDKNIIRHIVVTVDNLPRKTVGQRLLPVQSAQGRLETEKSPEGLAIGEANFKRYAPFIAVLDQVDAGKLVALYTELYPLFQSAYRDLGYPEGYFNDRLVDVIDHMLAAPEPTGPILVQQPHILYRYADPELENSSAGHKLMIRIGKDNAQEVKRKMREIREALTQRPPG